MGSLISAFCDCRYEKEGMCLGGGMMDFSTYCNFTFYCENCGIIFEGNAFDDKVTCPKCHKDNVNS
jgi:Zn finger protein HypA/HybF involved in hydrogenase expression